MKNWQSSSDGGYLCNPQHQVDGLNHGTKLGKGPFDVAVAFPGN